jgi:hypothetical protein
LQAHDLCGTAPLSAENFVRQILTNADANKCVTFFAHCDLLREKKKTNSTRHLVRLGRQYFPHVPRRLNVRKICLFNAL